MSEEKINVIIAGRNNDAFLKDCLLSVLEQNPPPLELIYIDDGSTDQTLKILKDFQLKYPILKVEMTSGIGISKARNLGNEIAKGEYIAILDSDDAYLPNAMKEFGQMIASKSPDLVYADCQYVNEKGHNLGQRIYRKFSDNKSFARAIMLLPQVPFKHSAILYKKKLVEQYGGYDEKLKQQVDIDLLLRFLLIGKAKFEKLDFIVSNFTKHSNQISKKRLRALPNWFRLIAKFEPNYILRIMFLISRSLSETGKFFIELFHS